MLKLSKEPYNMNNAVLLLLFALASCVQCQEAAETVIEEILPDSKPATVRLVYKNPNFITKVEIALNNRLLYTYKYTTSNYQIFLKPHIIVLPDLEPCTEYNLLIRTSSRRYTEITTYNKQLFTTTCLNLPPESYFKYDADNELLKWMGPITGPSSILGYYVFYETTTNLVSNLEPFSLANLPGCSNVELNIIPVIAKDVYGKEFTMHITTRYKDPDGMDNFDVYSVSPTRIDLSWNGPKKNPQCVEYYTIQYNGRVNYTNSTSFTINDLEPCEMYNITMCIVTKQNKYAQCIERTETTKYEIPELLYSNAVAGSTSANIFLEYKNLKCIQKIQFSLNDGILWNNWTESLTISQQYFVDLLKPCTKYSLFMQPFFNGSFGKLTSETFKTQSVKIYPVENIKFDQETDLLRWDRPSFGAQCINRYIINYINYSVEDTVYDEWLNLPNLAGCSNYQIEITPMGEDGLKGKSEIKNIETGFKKPNPVKIIHADSSSPNSITVIWDKLTRNPNCVKNFTIFYSNQFVHTALTNHTIYNLEPCTRYAILICIGIIQRPTDGCTKQEITTQLTLPDVTIASIISKPFSGVVSLEYKNRNCIQKIEIELLNRSEQFDISSLPKDYLLEKLRPCTRYNLIVNTSSLYYTKIAIANKTFETKSVAINAVKNVKFDKKIGLLKWTRPYVGSECMKGYIIYDGLNKATCSQESYDLSYLPGCQNFDIEITPMGENGQVGLGYTLKLETAFKKPGAVNISSINSNSPSSISISYTSPALNSKCVRNYAILYNGRTEYTNTSRYDLNNLEACTEYNIKICIVAINNETGPCSQNTQNITTKPALPKTTIGTIIPGPTFLDVPLEYKNMNCIKKIQIGIINETDTLFNSSNLPMNYRVGLLNPCTNFLFYVNTFSDHYVGMVSTSKTFKTKPGKIHSVQGIKFNEKTNLLTWLRPSVGVECLEHYVLDDAGRKVNTSSEFFNLSHLPGCSNFSIQITPVGGLGATGMPNVVEIQTGMQEPDSVKIEFAGISNPSQITVNWTIPRKNPNCVKHYAIIYNENTEYTNLNTHTIQNLVPCTTHNIQICIVKINNKRGLCTTHSENITTESATPEITINSIVSESTSANISLAYKNPSCIWYFEIILNNTTLDKYEKSDLKKFYVVNQLKPCSEYHLVIKIHHSLNTNQSFYTSKTFITKSVRNLPKIDHIEFNENSGLLKWKRPDFGAECIRRYSVDSNGITNITTTESLDLAYLPGCTKFEIGITPEGDKNLIGETHRISIETGFKHPDRISNLYALFTNPNSISMVWNAPYKNLNCVSQYEIKYEHNKKYTNLTEYAIQNLEPCREYNIQICIFMKNNETGMCAEGQSMNTTIGISSGIQQLRYKNSAIEWQSPSYGAGCVQKYVMMMYDELGHQIISEEIISHNFRLDKMKIKSCTNYTVSIIPINFHNGQGDTKELTFKTEPIKPEAPSASKIISKTATSLELESDYENDRDQCPLKSALFTCIGDDVRKSSSTIVWLTQNERKFSAAIHDLEDLTNYTCTVRIENANYSSEESPASEFETNEKLSDPPDFWISLIQSKSLSIVWKAPNNRKLRLKSYQVRIMKIGTNYAVPAGCQISHYIATFVIEADHFEYNVSNLEPFTKYSVQMAIENSVGICGYSHPIEVVTGPDSPHQVNNFRVDRLNYDHTVELKWDLPCEINGEIIAIKGTFYESSPTNTSVISYEWKLKSSNDLTLANFYKSKPIKPEHTYNITIGIELQNFPGPMNETSILYTSPAGIPAAYVSSNWGFISQATSPRNHVKLIINKNLFNATNGRIQEFTFLISERNCQKDPRPNYYFYKNNVDQPLQSWFDFKDDECTGQYQIQKFPNVYNTDEDGSFEFIIGNETCDNTKRYSGYCNGPLKSETDYALIARVFTSVGFADTNPIYFSTENNFPTLIIIIVLCIIIALVIGLGFVWFKRKRTVNRKPPTLIVADKVEIATKSTTTLSTHKYSHLLKYDPEDIADEYDSINALDSRNLTTVVAEENYGKNRYVNILPYDHNRVYVTPNTYGSTDYINASYINGYVRRDEYIATQGPTDDTCYDFWNMIIEKNCHQIIMLAKLFENRTSKCAQYYPDPNAELKFNNICVANIRQLDLDLCTRRDIKITKETVELSVVQYHFQKWPDHGCPKNELDLIKFIEFIRSECKSRVLNVPIVVHCSAGVGRTGTLIALDISLQQIENNQDCNVYETVKNLRHQRMKMVQTLVQYEFVYKCVARYLRQK